jgi:hypothetical protein
MEICGFNRTMMAYRSPTVQNTHCLRHVFKRNKQKSLEYNGFSLKRTS